MLQQSLKLCIQNNKQTTLQLILAITVLSI